MIQCKSGHLDRREVDADGVGDRVGDEAGDGDRPAARVEQGHLQADRTAVAGQLTKVQQLLKRSHGFRPVRHWAGYPASAKRKQKLPKPS